MPLPSGGSARPRPRRACNRCLGTGGGGRPPGLPARGVRPRGGEGLRTARGDGGVRSAFSPCGRNAGGQRTARRRLGGSPGRIPVGGAEAGPTRPGGGVVVVRRVPIPGARAGRALSRAVCPQSGSPSKATPLLSAQFAVPRGTPRGASQRARCRCRGLPRLAVPRGTPRGASQRARCRCRGLPRLAVPRGTPRGASQRARCRCRGLPGWLFHVEHRQARSRTWGDDKSARVVHVAAARLARLAAPRELKRPGFGRAALAAEARRAAQPRRPPTFHVERPLASSGIQRMTSSPSAVPRGTRATSSRAAFGVPPGPVVRARGSL
jgi:hypothetical protein